MKKTAIIEALNNLNDSDLIAIHNEYCEACNNTDHYAYMMDDFDEIMCGVAPWEVARSIFFGGGFNPMHKFFTFNGYGNLVSFNYPLIEDAARIYVDDIAKYITDNNEDFGNDDIRAILEGDSDEE